MEIVYEKSSLTDIGCIVNLKIEMFREFGYDSYLAENAHDMIVEDYCRMYEEGLAIHFLAKVDSSIVGMAGAFIKSDIPFRYFSEGHYGFIGDVYTMPSYRKQGVSMKLNQDALIWLEHYGVSIVRLLASDAGRPIYERLGFSPDVDMVLKFDRS